MITMIFNADDFGYSRGVNHGIIDAYKYGVVNSTTMMMNMYGTEHAILLAKENPNLHVGIHLVLTCGTPLSKGLRTIITDDGNFFRRPGDLFECEFDIKEVEKEWRAQIKRFYMSGLKPSHFDSHHHVHMNERLCELFETLALEYDVPVRTFPSRKKARAYTDYLVVDFYKEGVNLATLDRVVNESSYGDRIEIMTHPGYMDSFILQSSYNIERVMEIDVLTTWEVPGNVNLRP